MQKSKRCGRAASGMGVGRMPTGCHTLDNSCMKLHTASEQKDTLNKKYSCNSSNISHSTRIIRLAWYCMVMSVNVLETAFKKERLDRYFVLCESCFWCSSLLRNMHIECPVCATSERISLIPLTINESYHVRHDPRFGLEVSFSISNRS
jgi:hypothetical protein